MNIDLYQLQSAAVEGAYALPETESGYGFGRDGNDHTRVHYNRDTDKFSLYRNHVLMEMWRREFGTHEEDMNADGWANDPEYLADDEAA